MRLLQNLEPWGRARILRVLARALPTVGIPAQEASETLRQNPPNKILFVGIYLKMGQFLCATPLLRALKSAWPQASLHYLGNPENAAASRANPHLDHVRVWRKSAFWQWPGQLRALRKERFDLALLLTTERPSATAVLLARAIGARWVAAYTPSISGEWAQDISSLCHIRIPPVKEKNEVEKFLGLARAFDIPPQGRQPELVPAPADDAAAETFLSSLKFTTNGPLVGLFIGGKAIRSDRLWPVSHFARLATLLKEAGFRVIALSPPPPAGTSSETFESEEHLRLEAFRRALSWTCPVFQDAALGRVAAFIRKLNLLVCPDGGILHVAASVGTPTLGLFFSTPPEVWRHDLPQTILDGRDKPAAELRPETVAHEVTRFLGEASTR